MVYEKTFPAARQLLSLARQVKFPATAGVVRHVAIDIGTPTAAIDFLELFEPGTIFSSRADFMGRCEELEILEILIDQERVSPAESLRSPQD